MAEEPRPIEELTFREAMAELDGIVGVLESNTLELEESLASYERGVKLAGNGYWLYTDMGARLEWALLNYFITTHIKDGYTFMLPPHILTYACGFTAGQFPKFVDDVYRVNAGDDAFHFLLPTAETALINLYRGEILEERYLQEIFILKRSGGSVGNNQ